MRGLTARRSTCSHENCATSRRLARICRGCSFCRVGPAARHHARRIPTPGSGPRSPRIGYSCSTSAELVGVLPVLAQTADRFPTSKALADYLAHFRADAIVGDAEILRQEVCHGAQWSTLGQSYGGFITVTYLSRVPEALQACYVTGGLPGLTASADDVYALTYPKVVRRVADYYARYPADRAIVRTVADILGAQDIRLPDGDRFTVRRLQYLGQRLGMSDGFEFLHWLFERAPRRRPAH